MTTHHLLPTPAAVYPTRYGYFSVAISVGLIVPLASLMVTGQQEAAIAQSTAPSAQLAPAPSPQATTTLHVDPVKGNDTTADGSDRAPFKTITRALDVAVPNTTIQLAPGVYSNQTGEVFPLALQPRVTLQGNADTRGQDIVIQGGGTFASPNSSRQNITILGGANQSSLVGVTLTNPNPEGYALQIEASQPTIANNTFVNNRGGGILVVGSSGSIIRNNFFAQNGENGLRIQGNARPTVQDNIIEQSKTGIWVGDTAAPLIVGNRITQNQTGIRLEGQAQPKLRVNSVEGNEQFGLEAIAQARPDLGTGADADTNFFRNNGKQDVALRAQPTPAPAQPTEPSVPPVPEEPTAEAPVLKPTRTNATTPTVSPGGVNQSPDAAPARPSLGSVVVPVVTTPAVPSAPGVSLGDRGPIPASSPPLPAPIRPILTPSQSANPQPNLPSKPASGITSTAFPVPAALTNPNSAAVNPRPMQIQRMEPAPTQLPLPRQPEGAAASTPAFPPPLPIAPMAEEIPAPPKVAPRPAAQRPLAPVAPPLPTLGTPFPVPRTMQAPPQRFVPPAALPVPLPVIPTNATTVAPARSIPIPVPPPDSDRVIPIRAPKPPRSPLASPPLAQQPSNRTTNALLPVPGPDAPIGNVSGMPSVFTARSNRQAIPGIPITPETAGSVVVKYRVVVVATNNVQQEQIRSIVPDAFPVIVRGQRVMQAGAFGDRSKADQLVASLNIQGLQALIEPLE
ncbi:MAG: DUF1565 domain-containing protein [Leptolyngbyaceae cyanobacterium bins.349]|nr:DUF1565 domain-containing protein [Leptolyngbyaceae cyanobacterium bins.349]